METLLQDVKFALRILWKNRGVTLIAIAALALGIGANSAIFSVVNAVALRPLPYKDSERIFKIWGSLNQEGLDELEASAPEYVDYTERLKSFERVAAYSTQGFNLTGVDEPERIQGATVTESLLPLLGVEPARGRVFRAEEDKPGGDDVAVISHGLWQRRFGSDPNVVGKQIALDGRTVEVVGVMPEGFYFPDKDAELWKPIAFDAELLAPNNRGSHFLEVVGRIKPGVSFEQAQAEIASTAQQIGQDHAANYPRGFGAKIRPLHEEVVGDLSFTLYIMLGAVGFVLLIACANVANLMLARAAARQKEVAVRTALGATRLRIVRQFLTESVLLALAGGAAGLLIALWGIDLLVGLAPAGTPRVHEVGLDGRVVAFTFGVSLLTGVLFGLVPALQASKADLNESLKEGGRGAGEGSSRRRVRGVLVVTEFALALVLLVGAGLLVKSFMRVQEVSPGFEHANVLTMRLVLPQSKYEGYERQRAFFDSLLGRLRALPGVEAVGANNILPFTGGGGSRSVLIEGRPVAQGDPLPEEQLRFVTADYFNSLRIPLLQGRDFTDRDDVNAPRVCVVSLSTAEKFWPGEEAVGKRIAYAGIGAGGDPKWIEVVGIVGDVKFRGLETEARPHIYVPVYQPLFEGGGMPPLYVAVRTATDPAALAPAIRREVSAIDKDQPVASVKTMTERVSESVAQRRFQMTLLGIFACVALILASVGVYGVMSYTVAQRTHEIGIRMALGARPRDVLTLIVRQGMMLAVVGTLAGLAAAFASMRILNSLLYGVSASDPFTFGVVTSALFAVALIACVIPARRAMKVDPMIALRCE